MRCHWFPRITRRRPLLVATCLFLASATPAGSTPIFVAASGQQADLQAAVDAAAALTEPAVILLGPGAWELFGTVRVEVDHLTILGAGPDRTLVFRDHEDTAPFLRVQNCEGVRVSGIGFRGSPDPASATLEVGIRVGNAIDFRIDHCRFEYLGNSGVMTQGDSRGVIDHSSFDHIFKPAIGNYGYGVSIYGVGVMEAEPFGSARATFIEDSVLAGCRHATASNNGARYVLRHSHVTANEFSHAIDAHGDEYNSTDAGTEWIDVHHVLVDNPVYVGNAIRIRGGMGVIWSNTIHGYNVAVNLTENTPQETGPVYIWDNSLSPGTTPVSVGAGAEAVLSAPVGYQPYRYPHPLVDDLVAAAGPHGRYLVTAGTGEAPVYLDARGSTAAEGTVTAARWYAGDALLSECAVDIRPLPQGEHLILLEVERTDGMREHNLAVIQVTDTAALTSTTSWASQWFVPLVEQGAVELDVTPATSPMDGYVAVTGRWPVTAHGDNAAIVRLNSQGFFDARNGAAYASQQEIPYQAGQTYRLRLDIDLSNQTYGVTVDGAPLATGYAFRLPATTLGQITAWHSSGGLTAGDLTVTGPRATPDPACAPDGGLPDGGVPDGGLKDASAPSPDASTSGDGASPGTDTGTEPPPTSRGGCGCAARARGASGNAGAGLGFLLLLVLMGLRAMRP